jgi:hypothetical protein
MFRWRQEPTDDPRSRIQRYIDWMYEARMTQCSYIHMFAQWRLAALREEQALTWKHENLFRPVQMALVDRSTPDKYRPGPTGGVPKDCTSLHESFCFFMQVTGFPYALAARDGYRSDDLVDALRMVDVAIRRLHLEMVGFSKAHPEIRMNTFVFFGTTDGFAPFLGGPPPFLDIPWELEQPGQRTSERLARFFRIAATWQEWWGEHDLQLFAVSKIEESVRAIDYLPPIFRSFDAHPVYRGGDSSSVLKDLRKRVRQAQEDYVRFMVVPDPTSRDIWELSQLLAEWKPFEINNFATDDFRQMALVRYGYELCVAERGVVGTLDDYVSSRFIYAIKRLEPGFAMFVDESIDENWNGRVE